jgi:hypothetical protein
LAQLFNHKQELIFVNLWFFLIGEKAQASSCGDEVVILAGKYGVASVVRWSRDRQFDAGSAAHDAATDL